MDKSTRDTAPATKATPVNEAVREVAETISAGNAPTTGQLNKVLARAEGLIEAKKEEAPLNRTGEQLADEMKRVLGDTRQLLSEKNADDKLQRIVASAQAGGQQLAQEAKTEAKGLAREAQAGAAQAGISLPQAQKELVQASREWADSLREVATELVRSREFRNLSIEMLDMLREGMLLASRKAQEGLQKASEKLEEGTRKAESGIEEGKRRAEKGESPVKESDLPDMSRVAQEAKSELKGKQADLKEQGQELLGEVKAQGQEALSRAQEEGRKALEEVKAGQIPSALPLSDEQRLRLRKRLDNLLRRIGHNQSYRRALESFFRLMDQLRQLAASAVSRQERLADSAKSNTELSAAWRDTQALIAEFANGHTLDRFTDLLYRWFDMMQTDERVSRFWGDLRSWAWQTVENPDVALTEERTVEFNTLLDRARELAGDYRYSQLTQELFDEMTSIVDDIRTDPTTNKLITDIRTLFNHLMFDASGNVTWKPEEMRQFKILMLSLLLEELKYIPLPRIEGSTDKYDYVVQNAHFYGYDLLPDHININWENRLDLNLKDIKTDVATSTLHVSMTNIKTHMRNVQFWFRKKAGLIRMEDSGLADVDIAGDGAGLYIDLEYNASHSTRENRWTGFSVKRAKLDIDKMRVHIVDSHYDWLLNMVSPLIGNDMKRSIEREVEGRLRGIFDTLFMQLAAMSRPEQISQAGDIVKEQLKDFQAVKESLEPASHSA